MFRRGDRVFDIPSSTPDPHHLSEGTRQGMASKPRAQMSTDKLALVGAQRSKEIPRERAHHDPRLMQRPKRVLAEAPIVRVKFLGPCSAQWSGGLRRWGKLTAITIGALGLSGCQNRCHPPRHHGERSVRGPGRRRRTLGTIGRPEAFSVGDGGRLERQIQ